MKSMLALVVALIMDIIILVRNHFASHLWPNYFFQGIDYPILILTCQKTTKNRYKFNYDKVQKYKQALKDTSN